MEQSSGYLSQIFGSDLGDAESHEWNRYYANNKVDNRFLKLKFL